jgi:hypothetical protein
LETNFAYHQEEATQQYPKCHQKRRAQYRHGQWRQHQEAGQQRARRQHLKYAVRDLRQAMRLIQATGVKYQQTDHNIAAR